MRSLASLSSLWNGQTLDIQRYYFFLNLLILESPSFRTRRTIMFTIITAMLPLPLNIWGFLASFIPACGEMTHPPLLLLSNFVVIFNPLVYGFLNHALRKKLLQLWVFRCLGTSLRCLTFASAVLPTFKHKSISNLGECLR